MSALVRLSLVAICLAIAGLAIAAVPPRSQSELQEASSHIVIVEVLAVYSRVVADGELTNREMVTEVRIHCVEKGEGLVPGALAHVHS